MLDMVDDILIDILVNQYQLYSSDIASNILEFTAGGDCFSLQPQLEKGTNKDTEMESFIMDSLDHWGFAVRYITPQKMVGLHKTRLTPSGGKYAHGMVDFKLRSVYVIQTLDENKSFLVLLHEFLHVAVRVILDIFNAYLLDSYWKEECAVNLTEMLICNLRGVNHYYSACGAIHLLFKGLEEAGMPYTDFPEKIRPVLQYYRDCVVQLAFGVLLMFHKHAQKMAV